MNHDRPDPISSGSSRTGCEARAIAMDGSGVEEIVKGAAASDQDADGRITISDDARSLAMVRRTDGGYMIEHVDIATKKVKRLASNSASWFPAVSFEGAGQLDAWPEPSSNPERYSLDTGARLLRTPEPRATAPLKDISLRVEGATLVATRLSDSKSLAVSLSPTTKPDPEACRSFTELMRP